MLNKTDQSDRAPSPNEKAGKLLLLGTAERVRPVSTLLYAMAGGQARGSLIARCFGASRGPRTCGGRGAACPAPRASAHQSDAISDVRARQRSCETQPK